jgi:hypothetical protein
MPAGQCLPQTPLDNPRGALNGVKRGLPGFIVAGQNAQADQGGFHVRRHIHSRNADKTGQTRITQMLLNGLADRIPDYTGYFL